MKTLLHIFACLMLATPAYAGPGHDHGESAFAGGAGPADAFELTEQQITNLDIKTHKAQLLSMQNAVDVLAFTELLPEKTESISPHFEGKIARILVQIGETVAAGQDVVEIIPVNSVGTDDKTLSLKASKSGIVLQIFAVEGNVVPSGDDIMHIGDPSQMLVRGVAYETPDITKIAVGQRTEIHLDIMPERHIDGKIQRINRVIDPTSRTFSLYAIVDTPDGDIQPGLQGTMEIFTGDDAPVLAVPKRAILGEIGAHFVYVMKGHDVEKRDVTLGEKCLHHVEITSGLVAGEDVVVNGNYQLQYIAIGGVHTHDDHDHDHDHGDEDDHHDDEQ
ncbi:MAG: efflux RND transporter periplasmic adaptor subunit [Alphaproteobacteria bacterium]